MRKLLLMAVILLSLLAVCLPAYADSGADYVVQVTATTEASPAKITLKWKAPLASSFFVYKKNTSGSWDKIATLSGSVLTYEDVDVTAGNAYEYRVAYAPVSSSVEKTDSYGYIYAGIEKSPIEDRGKLILLVDNTMAEPLRFELGRLQEDLEVDGYSVIRHDISRDDTPENVKSIIVNEYQQDPQNVKSLFLFGHIPVVRSGNFAPDGHAARPWPADVFYADVNKQWSDSDSDGVYDYYALPSNVELKIGRVDLYNLPYFLQNETELLRRYLNKEHQYRTGYLPVDNKGLVSDNFGTFGSENFRNNGWGNFGQMVDTVQDGVWKSTFATKSFVWSHVNGGGTYTSVESSAYLSSVDFVSSVYKTVFMQIFGSYNGEWNSINNLMRSAIAMKDYGLTSMWTGRPNWFFHHMAMGEDIGYSTRLTQNNTYSGYKPAGSSVTGVHVALMGDPTLRMYPIKPASDLNLNCSANGAQLTWESSTENVLGYYVYKSAGKNQPYTRITPSIIAENSFTDTSFSGGYARYMVRAVKLQTTPSGSFYNLSPGVVGDARWTDSTYSVTFNSQGGSVVDGFTTGFNTAITKPADPIRTGYTFGGWYKEADCINEWNFTTDIVTGHTTLYAKWVETIYNPDTGDNTLSSLSYTVKGVTTPIALKADDLYPELQENRYSITLPMITKAYPADQMPVVWATPTIPEAAVTITPATVFPGTTKVSVTAIDGTTRNYHIRFKYAPGSISSVVNNITTNRTVKHDLQPLTYPEQRELFNDTASKWIEYNMVYSDRGISIISDTPGSSTLPATSNYYVSGFTYGWLSSNPKLNTYSTTHFNGASTIVFGQGNDKTQSGTGDFLTFNINRGAEVWYLNHSISTDSTNLSTQGWTLDNRYLLYQADGTTFSKNYYKHFPAGAVTIPKYGVNMGRSPMVVVKWDAAGTGNAALASLTATVAGTPQNIEIVPGQTTYRVMTAAEGDTPQISATLADPTAEIEIFQAESIPGNASVCVVSGQNVVRYTIEVGALSSDSSLKTFTYTHPMLGKQELVLSQGVTQYDVVLPYGISLEAPQITAQANHAYAVIESTTQATALPGSASVVVKAEDGTTSTYLFNFSVASNPPTADHLPGNISNVMTRYNNNTSVLDTPQASASVYAVPHSRVLPSTRYDSSTGYLTTEDRIAAAMLDNNPYWTSDASAWAFGDRPVTYEYPGTEGNPIRLNTQNVIVEGTSPILVGEKVSRVLVLNNEKDVTVPISDFYSFKIDKGATVYAVAANSGFDARYTDNGWTKEPSLKVNRGNGTKLQRASNSLWYMVPNGVSSFPYAYSKRYSAGASVAIPNRGSVTSSGLMIFVVWDECNPTATLSGLAVNGTSVSGFASATTAYTVQLPKGTTEIPTITATPTVSAANVQIANPSSLPGTATATVTAGDGVSTAAYTINYTLPLDAGDVNADGSITISDVIMAAEIAVGYTNYTTEQRIRANVSDKIDMTIDISDVVLIIGRAVGGTTVFPVDMP